MPKESRNLIIVTIFILFISVVLTLGNIIKGSGLNYVLGTLIGLILLIRNFRKLMLIDVIMTLTFGLLMSLYYLYNNIDTSPLLVMIIPSYLGSMASIRKNDIDYKVKKNSLGRTIIIIFAVGLTLGLVNLFLMTSTEKLPLGFHLTLSNLLKSFIPGISEEIILRFTFLSLVFSILKRKPSSVLENVCTYLLMVVPHVLMHFSESIPLNDFLTLSFLFGLPLAYLQKEVDLVSSMGVHGLVDFIRFVAFNS